MMEVEVDKSGEEGMYVLASIALTHDIAADRPQYQDSRLSS